EKLIQFVDKLIVAVFNELGLNKEPLALFGLGSYGRKECQLHSDIDLLLIHAQNPKQSTLNKAQTFIQILWDIGLEVSQQIAPVSAIAELARTDLSLMSSLLDLRLISGQALYQEELTYHI